MKDVKKTVCWIGREEEQEQLHITYNQENTGYFIGKTASTEEGIFIPYEYALPLAQTLLKTVERFIPDVITIQ